MRIDQLGQFARFDFSSIFDLVQNLILKPQVCCVSLLEMGLLIEIISIAGEYSTVFDQVDLSHFFIGSFVNLYSANFSCKFGIRKVHVECVKVRLALAPVIHVSFLQTSQDNTNTIIVKSIVLNTVEVEALSFDILCQAFNSLSFNTIIDEPFSVN